MKNKQLKHCLYLALFSAVIVLTVPHKQSAQESTIASSIQSAGQRLHPAENHNFVLYENANGISCRRMTEQEKQAFHPNERAVSVQVITDAAATEHITTQSQDEVPWRIVLRGTQQLESQPEAKAVFLRVASRLESVLRSRTYIPGETFTVQIDVDFGLTWFGAPYQAPSTVGVTSIGRDGIVAVQPFPDMFSGKALAGSQQRAIFQALPFPIKTEFGDTVALRWTDPVFQSLLSGHEAQPRFAIGFNSALRFDFDPSNGIDADKVDFETLTMRELLRVFSFVSNVGARELNPAPQSSPLGPITALPSVLDIYRFRPGVTMETFTTAPRALRAGGEQVFFTGDLELPLSTARPNGTGGDGRTADHWKDDELTGQYIGIMDPTYAPGERGGLTANDLTALSYFSFRLRPDAQVTEILSVDDNSREQTLPSSTTLIVNRFTPARAPSNVESVRVQLPNSGASVVGKMLRVVVFADANRTGQPPVNPQFLADRTITIAALPENRMLEVLLLTPVTITSGDLYVGVQAPNADLAFAADSNAPRNRSFVSSNNGASFQPLQANTAPANAIVRAVVNAKFNAITNRPPEITALSPNAAPSGTRFKVTVFGRNFLPDAIDAAGVAYKSIIRLNGQNKATEFLSSSQLRMDIVAADLAGLSTAQITVLTMTPTGNLESAPMALAVTADAPVPVLTQLDQSVVAVGLPTFRLTITGRNFTTNSVARFNGSNRQTRVINNTKLEVTLTASDLVSAANGEISVLTPGPGGGTSNGLPLRVAACTYRLTPTTTQPVGATRDIGNPDEPNLHGVLLETEDHCPWTVQASASWIEPTDLSGMGRAPIGYNVRNNPTGTARAGTLTVAGQTLNVIQVGIPIVVSSASYEEDVASESIASMFGTNLAKTTQIATTLPLPTNLAGTTVMVTRFPRDTPQPAQLFFVSPTQINFLVPPVVGEPVLPNGETDFISVFVDGQLVADGYFKRRPAAPALFSADASGKGLAAAVVLRLKADGTQVFEPVGVYDRTQMRFVAQPIDLGPEGERVFLLLFGTGIRGGGGADSVLVYIANQLARVTFAGAQGSLAGLDQINVELSRSLRGRGEVTVFCVADIGSNEVTVQIR